MKNILLLIVIVFIASCKKEESPRPVAEKFLAAMQKRDYAEAASYGNKETNKLLKQLQKVEELNHMDVEMDKPGKITVLSEEIRGNVAIVYFTEEGNDQQQKITLRRDEDAATGEKKEWKVALRKEEMRLNKKPGLELPEDSLPAKIPA